MRLLKLPRVRLPRLALPKLPRIPNTLVVFFSALLLISVGLGMIYLPLGPIGAGVILLIDLYIPDVKHERS